MIVWIVAGVIGTAGSVLIAFRNANWGTNIGGVVEDRLWFATRDGTLAWTLTRFAHGDAYFLDSHVWTDAEDEFWAAHFKKKSAGPEFFTGGGTVYEHTVRAMLSWWPEHARSTWAYACTFGWPLRSNAHIHYSGRDGLPPLSRDIGTPVMLSRRVAGVPGRYILPTHILPFEFALNVLFWGVIPAVFVFFVLPDRRAMRRRRGRCPACNYDLRGLPAGVPCPECGEAIAGAQSAPVVATAKAGEA